MATGIGAVGCGNISETYFRNLNLFHDLKLVACSDLDAQVASRRAAQFGIDAISYSEMLRNDDIDVILNLTVPTAHTDVSMAAIDAGKHVFSEKPLALSIDDGRMLLHSAAVKGVRIGAAPDTILGPGVQVARRLIQSGGVGDVVTGTAAFMSHGMEHWHPNPAFFYGLGGGPVMDMGPYCVAALVALLGPVKQVVARGRVGLSERLVTAEGPMRGRSVPVEVFTTVTALLSFGSGAEIVFVSSWDVWRHGLPPIELHGRHASLRLPDPDQFGGTIHLTTGRTATAHFDTATELFGQPSGDPREPDRVDYRGLGLADMVAAINAGRPHRCSGEYALHVLAVMTSIIESAREGRTVDIVQSCEPPAALEPSDGRVLVEPGIVSP